MRDLLLGVLFAFGLGLITGWNWPVKSLNAEPRECHNVVTICYQKDGAEHCESLDEYGAGDK